MGRLGGRLYRENNGENRYSNFRRDKYNLKSIVFGNSEKNCSKKNEIWSTKPKDEDKRHAAGRPVCGVPVLSPY